MESLAYVHQAIAYTDSEPAPRLVVGQNLNWGKLPSSAWLKFLGTCVIIAAIVSISEIAHASNFAISTNSGNGVYVRSQPTTAASTIGGLGEGTVVSATYISPGWLQIKSGAYAGGYISNWVVPLDNLSAQVSSKDTSKPGNGKYIVNTNSGIGLVVRSAPSSGSGSLGGLQEGQSVSAVASGNPGWLVINSGAYAGGYISSKWVVFN